MMCPVHHYPLKDSNGCWVCYDERRLSGKATAKKNKPKQRYEIPKVSDKKKKREAALAKVRAPMKKQVRRCQSCGTTEGPLDYSHILSVKHYPKHEAHPLNAVIECRSCHTLWESGTYAEKVQQRSWYYKKMIIEFLEPDYLHKLQLKA